MSRRSTANRLELDTKKSNSPAWKDHRSGRVVPAHTPLYNQGDDANRFFRVLTGVVMVYRRLEDNKRQISGFHTAGDFFGLTPDDFYNETAVTVVTSSVVTLTMRDFRGNPELRRELLSKTFKQLEDA